MAHDRQCVETKQGAEIIRHDYPKMGESYWNRYTHQVEVADRDLEEKFCIVKGEGE